MKKLFVCILLFSLFANTVNADSSRKKVELVKCDSLSNIWIKSNNEIKRIHLLAFETTSGDLDAEINSYTCGLFNSANLIELEYDTRKIDEYNRELVYVYLDNMNLQEDLLAKGYGQVDNITAIFKYTSNFCDIQKKAIKEGRGIWSYPNIEEKYCNSGVTLNNEQKEEKEQEKNKDNSNIKYIIVINSGILVLLLLMKREF